MKLFATFPGQVTVTLCAITALGLYPMMVYASGDVFRAAVAGGLMATLNVLAGYATIRYSIGKSMDTFLKYVLGGMGVRLLVLAGTLVILIRAFGFHPTALVASLGVFYVAYLAIEILFIQKNLNLRQSN